MVDETQLPDGTTASIKGEDLVFEKGDNENYTPIVPEIKVEVVDATNLTAEEKAAVQSAIESENAGNFPAGTTVSVANDGTATITYPDGTTASIAGKDLVIEKVTEETPDNEEYTPVIPEDKVEVVDATNLTPEEKAAVKAAFELANKGKFPAGTKIEVGNDGTITITYPDGSTFAVKGISLAVEKPGAVAGSGQKDQGQGTETDSGKLPKTGITSTLGAAAMYLLSGLGLASLRKKEDEE